MKLEPIEYDGGVIWVDKIYSDHSGIFYVTGGIGMATGINQGNMPNNDYCFKVVVQSPNLSIPNIPYVEIIENRLSADNIIDNHLNLVGQTNFDVYSNRDSVKEAMIMYAAQEVKSASVKKWSDEDMFGFAEEYAEYILKCEASKVINPSDAKLYLSNPMNLKKRKYSLQPKIKSIEIEMEQKMTVRGNADCWNEYIDTPITYQKDDKTFLKVKKINYV